MAYSEELADRIRTALKGRKDITERKMFGGIAFMAHGNMACGIVGADLMLRLGDEGAEAALAMPHTRPMDFTGKPMKSMLYVEPKGIAKDKDLKTWVDRALAFADTLPPK